MAIKKRTPYLCPKCGEAEDIEIIDDEYDDTSMRIECICEKCNAAWSEYFALEYTGYAHKGIDYNADGTKMYPDAPEGT